MCRFTFYHGKPILLKSIISDPDHSIIRQSYLSKERPEPLNGDGFGIGWFTEDNDLPIIYKSTYPAWNDRNLKDISHAIRSKCILAHVRASTFDSDIALMNCHPFKINNFMFCHNGSISHFLKLKKHLTAQIHDDLFQQIKGGTDSEYMFAFILGFLQKYDDMNNVQNMASAFKDAIAGINKLIYKYAPESHCTLNMAMTDGKNSVISRYSSTGEKNDTLYICQGAELRADGDKIRMQESYNIYRQSVVVSSEPLSSEGDWEPVTLSTIVTVDNELNVGVVEI